tara:strand:- start:1139 stop:2002 length:864 start_codon:yes stop_codon:yes gene_type:complete
MISNYIRNSLNQKGSSLVQVMVISGMVSVFGLAVMQTQKNVKSVESTLRTRQANDELRNAVVSLLKYPENCQLNLAFFSEALATSNTGGDSFVDHPDALLKDLNSAPVYVADSTTRYFGRAKIANIQVGRYLATKNLATLRVTTQNYDPTTASRGLSLGGQQTDVDIPVRLYYEGGVLERCMAEEAPADEAYTSASDGLLSQVCQSDLGGSFWNGECRMPTNIEKLSKSKDGTNATSQENLCQNLGGQYDVASETCLPGVLGGTKLLCAPDKRVMGFDAGGYPVCEP